MKTHLLIVAVLAALLIGCGGGGSSTSGGTSTGAGTLAVRLSDAPDPTITALNVTIPKVEANVNGQWIQVAAPNRSYNLLDLAKQDTLLGQASLPAGSYTQVRLFVSAASVTDSTGTHNVTVPSGAQTGLKINLDYSITPNVVTEILLDFNLDKSLIKQGNGQYRLQPVIPAVVKILSGTITGIASDGTATLTNAKVTATYTAGSSYPLGSEVNTTSSLADGTFKVWALLPGTYRLDLSYTNPTTSAITTATKSDVQVSANENTDVGSITLR